MFKRLDRIYESMKKPYIAFTGASLAVARPIAQVVGHENLRWSFGVAIFFVISATMIMALEEERERGKLIGLFLTSVGLPALLISLAGLPSLGETTSNLFDVFGK